VYGQQEFSRILRVTVCYSVCVMSQCVAVCCSVLQCVAVCCSVLQCVAVCCSVLQCVCYVTVCCSVLQQDTVCMIRHGHGVATISRLPRIIRLFCRIQSFL